MAKMDISKSLDPRAFAEEKTDYDIVGDVHGHYAALIVLLTKLGYTVGGGRVTAAPEGRKLVFLGDLCDRGDSSTACLSLAMSAVREGFAHMLLGNHEEKLWGWLRSLRPTKDPFRLELLEAGEEKREELKAFLETLPDHLLLYGGRLIAVHAAMTEELTGRRGGRVRALALYGVTTGRFTEDGLPERVDWAAEYTGEPVIVYGHIPVDAPRFCGRTVDIDTGAGQGNTLTALRCGAELLAAAQAGETAFRDAAEALCVSVSAE